MDDELSLGPFADDDSPTGMVPRHMLHDAGNGVPDLTSDFPHLPVPHHETDGDSTVVDYRLHAQAQLPFQDTALVEPRTMEQRQAPPRRHASTDTEEFFLDDLIDESSDTSDSDLPAPALPTSSGRIRIPMGKRKPSLPLPAPPSKSEPIKALPPVLPPAPGPSLARPPGPQHMPGPQRSRPQPAYNPPPQSPAAASRVPTPASVPVPVPVEEDYDRSTAVAADPLAPLKTPLIGGRYRIVERVGAGGMGKVFKVTHAQLGKTFALKIISDNMAGDDKIRELFYREARMASSLSHPNITSVVDFGEDPKLGAFMVMEFIQGEPLAKRLHREKRLGTRLALDIIRQVAEALDYIHSKGIVHCDIKTENILLLELPGSQRRQLQVKLLDFGLARSIVGGRNTTSLAGTPHYVAPERIRGAQASPSSDIYGLGILFYEILTGKVPWDGSVDHILHGHLELKPTPPSQLLEGGLDPALENLILRALAKTPAERHKDVAAFIYELQTVMDMLGYGRPGRRKRVGANKRATPAPRANSVGGSNTYRDETARALFDASRVPMALINRDGIIIVANPAFAQFIMGVSVDVEGLFVQETPLVNAWETFETDLARACAGTSMRRTIEVETEPLKTRRLLMWLDPGLSEDQAIFGVHPLEEG